jgi:hypothetical protein
VYLAQNYFKKRFAQWAIDLKFGKFNQVLQAKQAKIYKIQ